MTRFSWIFHSIMSSSADKIVVEDMRKDCELSKKLYKNYYAFDIGDIRRFSVVRSTTKGWFCEYRLSYIGSIPGPETLFFEKVVTPKGLIERLQFLALICLAKCIIREAKKAPQLPHRQ